MTKKFESIKIIKCTASPPHPQGTEYVICYGKETFDIDKNTKEVTKIDSIKVVIAENGLIIPNKSPVFPIGHDDFYRVTSAMNKLASDIMNNQIMPIQLIIRQNENSIISLEELRFEGSLVYDKIFYIKSSYDENGDFIGYNSSNPFLKNIEQPPLPTDIIYYRYKIYKTKKNNLLVYKEHCHLDENKMEKYFTSDYAVCDEISKVIGFTYDLPQNDILYLFFIRDEVKVTELKDI